MKKVRFLQDFQGVETKGLFYSKNKEYELDDSVAERMILDGRAVSVFVHAYVDETPQFENASIPPHYTEQVVELPKPTIKKRGKK